MILTEFRHYECAEILIFPSQRIQEIQTIKLKKKHNKQT